MNFNQDKIPSEVFYYKNKLNKHLIVYQFEDKETIPNAELLVLKGFKNIVLLTGGIKKFTCLFPNLIEGYQIPDIKLPEKSFLKRKKEIFVSPKSLFFKKI